MGFRARFFTLLASLALLAGLLPATALAAVTTVVVTAAAMDGWTISAHSDTDLGCGGTGTDAGTVEFVNGPASPPEGTGSVHFVTVDGNSQQRLRNVDYAGVALSSLTALGYWTYITNFNDGQAPYLNLYIDLDGDTAVDDRLWFEPAYQTPVSNPSLPDQGDPVEGAWQDWDALNGGWYSDGGFGGPGDQVLGLDDYITANPTARIINDGAAGGIRIATGGCSPGSWDNVDSNVDAFIIGTATDTITYDFELEAAGPITPALTEFRDVRRPNDINPGATDVCGGANPSINFTGSTGSAGDTWITVYDETPGNTDPRNTFGDVSLSADVLIKNFNNKKGAGLLALFNEPTPARGYALVIYNSGNTDTLVLGTVTAGNGSFTVLQTVSLGNQIAQCAWYRLTMDVDAMTGAVTGTVLRHTTATDPDSGLGTQVGGTLAFPGPRPATVQSIGEVGIVASAFSAVVDSSVTNFTIDGTPENGDET